MYVDIDVVESGRDIVEADGMMNRGTLRPLQEALLPRGAIIADNVNLMVVRILSHLAVLGTLRLDPPFIRGLRIYGHGRPGQQYIGGGLSPRDDQIIGIDSNLRLLNEIHLARLRGKFSASGFVVLHGCNVGADFGGKLLQRLDALWHVPVLASINVQTGSQAGDGMITNLHGTIVASRPRKVPIS